MAFATRIKSVGSVGHGINDDVIDLLADFVDEAFGESQEIEN